MTYALNEAWKNLGRAESDRDSAARHIASTVASGEKVDEIRIGMYRDADKAVQTADHIVKQLLERNVHSSD